MMVRPNRNEYTHKVIPSSQNPLQQAGVTWLMAGDRNSTLKPETLNTMAIWRAKNRLLTEGLGHTASSCCCCQMTALTLSNPNTHMQSLSQIATGGWCGEQLPVHGSNMLSLKLKGRKLVEDVQEHILFLPQDSFS